MVVNQDDKNACGDYYLLNNKSKYEEAQKLALLSPADQLVVKNHQTEKGCRDPSFGTQKDWVPHHT
jgi:hypothetical protein